MIDKPILQYGLQIHPCLYRLVEEEILPGTGFASVDFWQELANLIRDFTEENQKLLQIRQNLQKQLSQWHLANRGRSVGWGVYRKFLEEIGYLVPSPKEVLLDNGQVDDEVSQLAGPQLVVPVNNARYALNAANARWGSLYDALYGTDAIAKPLSSKSKGYNVERGAKVVAYARSFLDQAIPLESGSHTNSVLYKISQGALAVTLSSGQTVGLQKPLQLTGYLGTLENPIALLFEHNGLHIDIRIDSNSLVGKQDPAGIEDIILESALTTIEDCEDSVAAVDAEDKVLIYRNWLGLMKGNLTAKLDQAGEIYRKLNPDRNYMKLDGTVLKLSARSLMFVRNVGHLMTTDAVLDAQGNEVFEGLLDAMITSAAALHDIKDLGLYKNSKANKIYIVKPKMHGPDEVAFTNRLFARVEQALKLPPYTIKMGVMDEERRTSANLKACIAAANQRIVFINTGFLDRTGDEIHSIMEAGPVVLKGKMKQSTWIRAYEKRNVEIGLDSGFYKKAQIGKGMWAMPEQMAKMLCAKGEHLQAGATTSWVPSPTAATLHALHYHQMDAFACQLGLEEKAKVPLEELLTLPLLTNPNLSPEQINEELRNNVQGILGYVVRWIDQGVGCSKVADIHDVALMEDRATLRISSQHIANWLHHGLCSKKQVMEVLKQMSLIVDEQNAKDIDYCKINGDPKNLAFQAAAELIFSGIEQPNGYTEPVLYQYRKLAKLNQ